MQIVNAEEVEGVIMVALPVEMVEELQIGAGSPVKLSVADGGVLMRRVRPRGKHTLAELISGSDPRAFDRTPEDDEWFNAPPVGNEII
ncbi:MAG TPA: hypothetical protein VIJ79_18410 [Acidobacteriaceae bacterium]